MLEQSYFLKNPPSSLSRLQNPRIVSIGCGYRALEETQALDKLYYSQYSYLGIEIEAEKVNRYKIEPSNIRIMTADGSNLDALTRLGVKKNTFDVAIVRHPCFADASVESFRKIFRIVIPRLLKENGILIVSLYLPVEKKIIVKESAQEPYTPDTLLFKIQYNLLAQNSSKIVEPKATIPDNFMFYFENKCNPDLNQKTFLLSGDTTGATTMIEKLGGSVKKISDTEIETTIVEKYIKELSNFFTFTYKDSSHNIQSIQVAPDSPINNQTTVLKNIVARLNQITLLTPNWKSNLKNQIIWIETDENTALAINQYLTQNKISNKMAKVANKESYVVQLNKFNLTKLEQIQPINIVNQQASVRLGS